MNGSSIRPEPFRIEPIFSPRIWGSRSLAPLFLDKTDLAEPVGEAWLTGLQCKIANGPFRGRTLGETWPELTIGWRGSAFQGELDFPLLLKFIFPKDKLSIQVHPDDVYAAAHEQSAGGRGKTEMWHVVSAEPGARLLAGLIPGVTRQQFEAALADGTLESLFQSHEARAGDTFFIPAGTPHTIGPGMILCEVQEYSDLTYRVYDYHRVDAAGKPRELHVQKALDVIDFGAQFGGKVAPREKFIEGRKLPWAQLVDCPYFSVTKVETSVRVHFGGSEPSEQFRLWVFLEGQGQVSWSSARHSMLRQWYAGEFSYKQGECWFVPADFSGHSFHPLQKTTVLITNPLKDNSRS